MSGSGRNLVLYSDQFRNGTCGNYGSGSLASHVNDDGYLEFEAHTLSGTDKTPYISSWWYPNSGNLLNGNVASLLDDGEPCTVSILIRSADATVTTPPRLYIKPGLGYFAMNGSVSAEWSTIYRTIAWKADSAWAPHLGPQKLDGTYEIKAWKIERGTEATPWRAAPEDLDSPSDVVYASDAADIGDVSGIEGRLASAETGIEQAADAIEGKQDAGDYATADDLSSAVESLGADIAAKADAAETAGALEGLQGYAEELAQGAQAAAEATAAALASDASKKATGYITDISDGGILVHRDDDYDPEGGEVPAHGVRITDTVEIVRGGESMVEVGEQLRVGRADQTHMEGRANRLAFSKDGGDLAWFGQEDEGDPGSPWGLHTGMLYVEDMQRFGGFAWIKRANGNMTLKWIGSGE